MRKKRKAEGKTFSQSEECVVFGKDLGFAAAEAYRLLRTNILFALPDERRCRVVGVTSASSGEGKSTTALNLSYMLAEAGERTLLMEGDMRLPTISSRLHIRRAPGLSNVLAGLSGAQDALQESGLHELLQVICSGDIPPNPSELLGMQSINTLLASFAEEYDFIVMDLPPVTEVSDPLVASRLTDGIIMVVRQGYASRRAVNDAMQQLRYAEAKVLGFVLARAATVRGGKYYQRYWKPYRAV